MQSVAFQRNGKTIIAQVYKTYMEPQGDGKYLEVLFCEDSSGSRYRVPRNEVIVKGVKRSANKSGNKSAKQKGKNKRANRIPATCAN